MSFKKSRRAFTLVEIMIVIAIIGIIIAIAVPAFLRTREVSQARACQENLSKIEAAVDMYAMEEKKQAGDTVDLVDLVMDEGTGYLKSIPKCPANGIYDETLTVNSTPHCSIGVNSNASFAPHVLGVPVPDD